MHRQAGPSHVAELRLSGDVLVSTEVENAGRLHALHTLRCALAFTWAVC
jgi:hypothetical protein